MNTATVKQVSEAYQQLNSQEDYAGYLKRRIAEIINGDLFHAELNLEMSGNKISARRFSLNKDLVL